jgi:hypothetical protein
VNEIGLEGVDEAAQLHHAHWVRPRRLVSLTFPEQLARKCCTQLTDVVNIDAGGRCLVGVLVPNRGDADVMSPRRQLRGQHLHLALGPADEGRVVVGDKQDPHHDAPLGPSSKIGRTSYRTMSPLSNTRGAPIRSSLP